MNRRLRTACVPVRELNPNLMCALCGGYFIDATTIMECLHSFCRSCIVRYLESSKYCPICDVQVHDTRPLLNIRADQMLQDLVYKLVPGLFTREMKKRREFYATNHVPGAEVNVPSEERQGSSGSEVDPAFPIEDEKISISLEFSPDGKPPNDMKRSRRDSCAKRLQKRYLLCPAAFTIGLLKKFLRMKLEVDLKYQIDIFHTDEPLSDNYTLMDIAYIYTWRKATPFRLYYSVYEMPSSAKRPRVSETLTSCSPVKEEHKVQKSAPEKKQHKTTSQEPIPSTSTVLVKKRPGPKKKFNKNEHKDETPPVSSDSKPANHDKTDSKTDKKPSAKEEYKKTVLLLPLESPDELGTDHKPEEQVPGTSMEAGIMDSIPFPEALGLKRKPVRKPKHENASGERHSKHKKKKSKEKKSPKPERTLEEFLFSSHKKKKKSKKKKVPTATLR